MIDLDIKGFFDNLDWDLVLKAVSHHSSDSWVLLYVERWLRAPVQHADGRIKERTKGSPQGSVISPLLSNLFMHYAFDSWLRRTLSLNPKFYAVAEPGRIVTDLIDAAFLTFL